MPRCLGERLTGQSVPFLSLACVCCSDPLLPGKHCPVSYQPPQPSPQSFVALAAQGLLFPAGRL